MRWVLVGLTLFLFISPCIADNIPSIKERLIDALLCEADSLEVIREMVEQHSFDSGLAATTWGEEMDEKNVVIVSGGLEIAGAKTPAVISQFDSAYSDFEGIVFAEFKGEYTAVIKEFGLRPAKGELETALGKFVLPRPTSNPKEVCPPTVALTPLGNGRFVLGCGWCNG